MRPVALLSLASLALCGCLGDLGDVRPAGGADAAPDPGDAPIDAAPSPASARELLAQWSGCMTLANWETSGMGGWAQKGTEGGTVCSSCHAGGLGNVRTDVDSTQMFQMNRYEIFITGFFAPSSEGGTLDVTPAYARLEAVAGGADDHPTFAMDEGDPHVQALDTFHQLTVATRAAGGCQSPGFPAP